jgi:hyperosmotically inducible periplasmic protein
MVHAEPNKNQQPRHAEDPCKQIFHSFFLPREKVKQSPDQYQFNAPSRKPETFSFSGCLTVGRINMSIRVWASKASLTLAGVTMLFAGTSNIAEAAGRQDSAAAPDNTKVNKDRGMTADQQKENKSDREITRQIRKALVADKSLSSYAHNVKIITTNGTVTLRGPVRTEDEKSSIESKAKAIAGVSDVKNELTVAPKKG